MARQMMTRATLARKAPFFATGQEGRRQILGPLLLWQMAPGAFALDYQTRSVGGIVAVIPTDDDATIQTAIDEFIARYNRTGKL